MQAVQAAAPPEAAAALRDATSLGAFETAKQAATLAQQVSGLAGRRLLFVGDSSVRYQFMHLVRAALEVPRHMTLGDGLVFRSSRGRLHVSKGRGRPPGANQSDRGGKGDSFWNVPNWMVVTTMLNLTLAYVRQSDRDFRFMNGGRQFWNRSCDLLQLPLMRARDALSSVRAWPPDTVVWNIGLHLLHLHPSLSNPAVRCALTYGDVVSLSARTLRSAMPANTQLVWRTSNIICEEKLEGGWAEVVSAYDCGVARTGSPGCTARAAVLRGRCERDLGLSEA